MYGSVQCVSGSGGNVMYITAHSRPDAGGLACGFLQDLTKIPGEEDLAGTRISIIASFIPRTLLDGTEVSISVRSVGTMPSAGSIGSG